MDNYASLGTVGVGTLVAGYRQFSSKISFACEENRFSRFLVYFYLGLQNIFMLQFFDLYETDIARACQVNHVFQKNHITN